MKGQRVFAGRTFDLDLALDHAIQGHVSSGTAFWFGKFEYHEVTAGVLQIFQKPAMLKQR